MQFGAASEKLGREIAQLELALEELETESAVPDVEAPAPKIAPRPAPVRSLPDHLPREEIVHEPASGKYPRFVAGERRCPPEDVGGLPGLELFLDAMADPAHEEHDRLRNWYGGAYNPEDIDERFTRRAVAAIAIRRHAGKIAYEKSRPQ